MMNARAKIISEPPVNPATGAMDSIRAFADRELPRLVQKIDSEGYYPTDVLHGLGRLSAYEQHLPGLDTGGNLNAAIEAMAIVGEHCVSSSFCMWCQNALAWYIFASDNEALKSGVGIPIGKGEILGGTGLSNPMKSFCDIEPMRLKGTQVSGGYLVKGALPYVSNLGDGHYFAAVFEVASATGIQRNVMAVVPCSTPGLSLAEAPKFTALDGTGTYVVQMRDVFIDESWVLADPIDAYMQRIRAGFVLLQSGMAIGLIRDCIRLMQQTRPSLGHVNKYLDEQPEEFAEQLDEIQTQVAALAATPFEEDLDFWRATLRARLAAGEASVKAAHAAMLHCGARGYVVAATAQRRLREAYFIAIVTPATKHLRKMLADMSA